MGNAKWRPGPCGPTGGTLWVEGPRGCRGPQGAVGRYGATGAPGRPGATGCTGPQGLPGELLERAVVCAEWDSAKARWAVRCAHNCDTRHVEQGVVVFPPGQHAAVVAWVSAGGSKRHVRIALLHKGLLGLVGSQAREHGETGGTVLAYTCM